MSKYLDLKRKQHKLRGELRALDQEICELEGHPSFDTVVEWSYHGLKCTNCGKLKDVVEHTSL